ncbi:MAG: methyl-accepting chemotaxis protein [Marinicellaceae bacterium]
MNIRQKLLLATLLLTIVPAIIISVMIGYFSIVNSNKSLEAEAREKLIGVRDSQKNAIETYFESLGKDLSVMSDNLMVIEAMKQFNQSFGEYDPSLVEGSQESSALQRYYRDEYLAQYNTKNTKELNVMNLYNGLSPEAKYYQEQYIAFNPNPLGSKDLLDRANDNSNYSINHQKYHKVFRDYLNTYGLYDIFLVEPISGNIVYSVFKELDFATSLKFGPYKDSGLGRAFEQANNGLNNTVYFEDYKPYLPSYNDEAVFVSTPIYENQVLIGVLVYQAPIDAVNNIMTFDKLWKERGMGESGETYLVGPDGLLRNDSRFLIDDKANYISALRTSGVSAEVLTEIESRETSIGLQSVDTIATKNAFNNQTGFDIFPDYRGVPVLSAFTPISVFDTKWALMSEIDVEEAFAASKALRNTIIWIASLVTLFLILLGVLVALRFVKSLSVPIAELDDTVRKISEGDNEARAEITTQDELGKLGEALNSLMDEKVASLILVEKENEQLNNSVINLLTALNKITDKDFSVNIPVSEDIIGTVAASLNTLTKETSEVLKNVSHISDQVLDVSSKVQQTSNEVIDAATQEREQVLLTVNSLDVSSANITNISQEANNANELAETTIQKTKQALKTVQNSNAGINTIRETIFETEKRIKRLGDRSQEISGIVKLINNIAERTHILALNASMHAASAGEAGRGFAVVADEVQRLAENAKDSTEEISTLVNSIRTETTDTVNAMNNVISQVAKGTELSENAGAAMIETNETTESLVNLVKLISEKAKQQVIASDEIKGMAKKIELSTQNTEKSLDDQKISTDSLVQYSTNLRESVDVFTLPE